MMKITKVPEMDEAFCTIGIYLYGDSISIDDVSSLLGMNPTQARNRGDVRVTSSGAEVVQKIGFWQYKVKVNVDRVSSCLAELLDKIKCEKVVGKSGVTKAELDIFAPIDTKSDKNGFSFEVPSDVLRQLYDLGLDLIVTSR
jgi:hypothetical protein